jgi:phosphate transport system substrate-binding protein
MTMKKQISYGLSSLILAAACLAGCGGQSGTSGSAGNEAATGNSASSSTETSATTTTSGGANLKGAGATFPYPIYSKWFDAYNKAKGVEINYQSIGSGAGIKQLKANTVDFGASDAPLSDKDLKEFSGEVVHIPTVAGAVVISYNLPGFTGTLNLSGDVIANIFLGKITKWNDAAIAKLNPGAKLPDLNITVAHRSDGSGTTNIFTNYLSLVSPAWKAGPGAGKSVEWPVGIGGKGSDGVASTVKQSPGGLGYVELAYAKQNKLPYASVQNAAGKFVAPSAESTTAAASGAVAAVQKDIRAPIANASGAGAYPIAGFTYILAYKKSKDPAKAATLKDFLSWAITDGQKDAAALDYASLPPAVVEIDKKTIESLQ